MEAGMARASTGEPNGATVALGLVRFTRDGEAALDELSGRFAGECGDTPGAVAQVLDRILGAEVGDADELTAVDGSPGSGSRRQPGRT
jgi:hypothetical protein